jgi:hypothetical protein
MQAEIKAEIYPFSIYLRFAEFDEEKSCGLSLYFKTLSPFSHFYMLVFYLMHIIIYRCENVNILRIKNTNIIASVFFTLLSICFPINLYSPIFTVFLYPIIMRKKPLIAVYTLKNCSQIPPI